MSPKLLAALGVLLILIGLTLFAIRLAGERGSLFIASGALVSGGVALEMARRKKSAT